MKPILFNTEMVQAILEGRKTVTRRICKDGTEYTIPDMQFFDPEARTYAVHNYADKEHTEHMSLVEIPCPICPGDILYVRETWQFLPCIDCGEKACGMVPELYEDADMVTEGCWIYRADYYTPQRVCWKPSIHMPKEAARIFLRVTDVRVERLRNITEKQAAQEGASKAFEYNMPEGSQESSVIVLDEDGYFLLGFKALWNSTIKKADLPLYGWDANPWVWVIEFERCEKPRETGEK